MGASPGLGGSGVQYARVGDGAHLAYRMLGEGTDGHDVVLVLAGTMPMDSLFEDPIAQRFVEGLADLGRLVTFDRRGIGMSDPATDPGPATFARWCADLDAVTTAARLRRPVLVTSMQGTSAVLLYAAAHEKDVASIVLVEPSSPVRVDRRFIRDQIGGRLDPVSYIYPSRANEPGFREWFNRAGQLGASPRMAEAAYPAMTDDEIRAITQAASQLHLPTLVLRRPDSAFSPEGSDDPMMALLPNAVRVDIPGIDIGWFGGEVDALLAEIYRFVTGDQRTLVPERVLAAVLYTDLVASTSQAVELGDAHWKRVLDRHDEIARRTVGRRGGTVVKTTGDGFVAILPSTATALDAAWELRSALAREDLEVRCGIHVGDIDRRGEDIAGVTVAIAARLLALAQAGDILVTAVAAGATAGQGVEYQSRGEHHLKGVPGKWLVLSARATANSDRGQ